jgi:predicted Zn-dependent peptidase
MFDSTWNVFADRVMLPALDPAGLEVVRRRMLRTARSRRMHPDAMLRVLADRVAFNGHPYARRAAGCLKTQEARGGSPTRLSSAW